MKRRDPTFLLALVTALAAHLLLLQVGTRAASRDLGWWLAQSTAQARKPANLIALPPPPPEMLIGEKQGTGRSINTMPGEQPMESAVSDPIQEQAMASRDPVGFGRAPTAKPLAEVLKGSKGDASPRQGSGPLTGQNDLSKAPAPKSSKTPPAKPAQEKPAQSPAPANPPVVLVDPKAPANVPAAQNPLDAGPLAAKPNKPTNPQQPQQPQQEQQPTNPQQSTPGQQQGGGQSGSPDSGAGKPIPSANFESVPIAMNITQFVPGKMTAQNGRKLLTRQIPDLTLAGWTDVSDMEKPVAVILKLKIDETGNVTEVKTIRSSGSDSVDLPCERAAATWWFEPRKDPQTGKPVPDEIQFVISFK